MTFLFQRTLEGQRVQIAAYGLGLMAYIALIVFITPSISAEFEDVSYPEGLESFLGSTDFSDHRNFINSEVMTVGPLVLSIFAIAAGTATLAGEEGRGTIEILLSQPISRLAVFAQKAAALWAAVLLVLLVACAGFLVSVPFVDLGEEANAVDMILAPLAWLPFLSACLALSMLAGAVAPSRGKAVALVAAIVVLAYLGSSLAGTADVLGWLKYTSIFYYSDTQRVLTQGVVIWHQGILTALSIVVFALGLWSFQRRELYAGRWQLKAFLQH